VVALKQTKNGNNVDKRKQNLSTQKTI